MASENDSPMSGSSERIIKRPIGQLISVVLSIITANMVWIVFAKIQFFYTEELGMSLTVFLIVNTVYMIWNMVNDPLEGFFTDKPSKLTRKFGKRAPYVFLGHLGFSIAIILPFIVVADPETNIVGSAIWLAFSMCLFDAFISLMDINRPALFADKFRDPTQRKQSGVLVIVYAIIGMMVGSIVFPTIADGLADSLGVQTSWFIGAAVLAGFSLIITFLMIPGIREDDAMKQARASLEETQEQEKFFVILWKSLKEKNLMAYVIANLFYVSSLSLAIVALDYWMVYGLGMNISDGMVPMLAFMFAGPLAAPIWLHLSKKYGSKKIFIIGMVAFGTTFLAFLFVQGMVGTIIVMAISGLTSTAIGVNQWAIMSDVLDDTAVSFKKRMESSIQGVVTLFDRLKLGIQPLIFLIVQSATGWEAGADVQTANAIFGIKVIIAIVPFVFLVTGGIIFKLIYNITPEKAIENQQKMVELGF